MITTPVKLWRRQQEVRELLGKKGTILQWTIVRTPPKSFVQEAPYPVILVQLENGKKMMGQLVDWEETELKKGTNVVAILRKLYPETDESVISYVIKFRPVYMSS